MRIAVVIMLTISCASTTPSRRAALDEVPLLTPSSGPRATLVQRLSFQTMSPGASRNPTEVASVTVPTEADALLVLSEDATRLAIMAGGIRVMTLAWDGAHLDESRRPEVPALISARRTMLDLQVTWWPAEVLRAALPPGLTLTETERRRLVERDGIPILTIDYPAGDRFHGTTLLRNLSDGYVLTIDSRRATEGQPK